MWNAKHILQLTGGRGNLSCMRNFLHRPLALTHISSLGRKERNGGTSNELQAAIRHFGSRVGGGGGGRGMRRGHAVANLKIVKKRLRDLHSAFRQPSVQFLVVL